MTVLKRVFDIALAVLVLMALSPLLLGLLLWLAVVEGRPYFYVSERMKTTTQPFSLYKFRTMRKVADGANTGVSGGDKNDRISRTGQFLRRSRLDEIPQLWNVIRGDMSLVGPRPPLRQYTDAFPDLYRDVLKNRPGITGLATLVYHAHEERLLAACTTADETQQVYVRRCVPRKARLDLIYRQRRSFCFDLKLLALTAGKPVSRKRR